MTHIFGFERSQLLLLPESVDDYVGADNPVHTLRQLDPARHPANREVIRGVPYDKLQAAWIAWLQFMRRP
jgi:hypothetical protein